MASDSIRENLLHDTYELLEELGQGGMGQVFKAQHRVLKRIQAIKVIRPECTTDQKAVERFRTEITAVARLTHPNIVMAFDAGEENGIHYLAMEYVEGQDLSRVIQCAGRLGVAQAADYVRQAALGLQHVLEAGLVHRDIKPSNLMLTRDGRTIKLLDLGLARLRDDRGQDNDPLTPTGTVMGTPDFMAPEQFTNSSEADIRADVYSLGCTFYQMLTGQVPFPGGDFTSKLHRHRSEDPRPLTDFRSDLPTGLVALVSRMTAKERDDRPESPKEVADGLAPFCKQQSGEAVAATLPTLGMIDENSPRQASSVSASMSATSVVGTPRNLRARSAVRWQKSLWLVAVVIGFGVSVIGIGPWRESGTNLAPQSSRRVAAPLPDGAKKEIINVIGMRLRLVPRGVALLGPSAEEGDRGAAGPPHGTEILEPFYVGVYEVTQGEYQQIMGRNPSFFSKEGEGSDKAPDDTSRFPVENVTWYDCVEFCIKLSEKDNLKPCYAFFNVDRNEDKSIKSAEVENLRDGTGYRLPNVKEWEYACRGGSVKHQVFAFGDTLSSEDHANFHGMTWLNRTTEVGRYDPNGFGLFDVHGNVEEWCQDKCAGQGWTGHRICGGSWASREPGCAAANRSGHDGKAKIIGFRVVRVFSP